MEVLEKLKAKQAEEEDAEADEEPPATDLCGSGTQDTEETIHTKPTVENELQQSSVEETGAGRATELPSCQPAKSSGQDQPEAAPDDPESVPQSDLPRKEGGA